LGWRGGRALGDGLLPLRLRSRVGGLQLREFGQFIRDQLISLQLDPNQLRTQWARARTRKELRDRLDEWHITAHDLAEWAGQPDADTIDLLLNVGWEIPLLSRAERARRVQTRERGFLESFAPEAREVLNKILEQYAALGAEELDISALQSRAYSSFGTVVEIARRFDGDHGLRSAIDSSASRFAHQHKCRNVANSALTG
jgi:type I restriction enzyme R subunit